jgi:hypothetical protein
VYPPTHPSKPRSLAHYITYQQETEQAVIAFFLACSLRSDWKKEPKIGHSWTMAYPLLHHDDDDQDWGQPQSGDREAYRHMLASGTIPGNVESLSQSSVSQIPPGMYPPSWNGYQFSTDGGAYSFDFTRTPPNEVHRSVVSHPIIQRSPNPLTVPRCIAESSAVLNAQYYSPVNRPLDGLDTNYQYVLRELRPEDSGY